MHYQPWFKAVIKRQLTDCALVTGTFETQKVPAYMNEIENA